MEQLKYSQKEIDDALYRRAIGYDEDEIIEEYVIDDGGEYKLNKRKVTKKHISPDLMAAKLVLEKLSINNEKIKDLTDEQIYNEKLRLLDLLHKKKQ